MSGKSQELLRRCEAGESEAAVAIFDRYVARLVALAESRMSPKLRQRVDAEDVVQSAYRSFFLHTREGDYELNHSGDLWRLLAKITLHKLYGQIERQQAEKRSIDREVSADCLLPHERSTEPAPVEAIAAAELLQIALAKLSSGERESLVANLQGRTVDEVADEIGKSPRTVRRLLASAKVKIERHLLDDRCDDEAPQALTTAEAPLRYSDFVLEQLLGSGGMGKVYRAREKATGKVVAIKALHKSRQRDARAVAQLVQEAQILAQLNHAHIVSVHGLGQFPGGGCFMVMDYVEGTTLRDRLRDRPLAASEIVPIMKQVAAGIQHAHEHNIVHCDLKPENVLLDSKGRAVVTDFGFAHIIAGTTSASSIGGTAGFIAPEVMSGRSLPTPAADIYGMGMLMRTLLTNQPINEEAFDAIIQRCIAEDPSARYGSASEFAKDLESLCQAATV